MTPVEITLLLIVLNILVVFILYPLLFALPLLLRAWHRKRYETIWKNRIQFEGGIYVSAPKYFRKLSTWKREILGTVPAIAISYLGAFIPDETIRSYLFYFAPALAVYLLINIIFSTLLTEVAYRKAKRNNIYLCHRLKGILQQALKHNLWGSVVSFTLAIITQWYILIDLSFFFLTYSIRLFRDYRHTKNTHFA